MTVSLQTIQEAYSRIHDSIHLTPVLTCSSITRLTPYPQLFLKCENLQKIGAFKIRGALNAVRKAGGGVTEVVTHSSGNHAQAIALACTMAGINSHIIIPKNAPKLKREATEGYGAKVYLCEPNLAARESLCKQVLSKFGAGQAKLIHPFDDDDVISGQGTIAVELDQQLPKGEGGLCVVVPVGGGGMLSGVSIAIKALRPGCIVIGAEPQMADDASRSLQSGKIEAHTTGKPNTIADGLLTTLCPRTLRYIQQNVDEIVTVSEQEIAQAMRLVLERAKLVIEPSAAVGVAVALSGRIQNDKVRSGKVPVCVVLCGGNVAVDDIPTLLAKGKL